MLKAFIFNRKVCDVCGTNIPDADFLQKDVIFPAVKARKTTKKISIISLSDRHDRSRGRKKSLF